MADKIRVGIVGATVTPGGSGWGANAHVPALGILPDFELKAVCTAHQETAEASKAAFGAELAFDNIDAMANHPEVDVVVVCVRVPWHKDLVMAGLKAGKPVFCEWPLGANLAEAEEMANYAREHSLQTFVGLQGRNDPTIRYAADLVADGYVGRVLTANLHVVGGQVIERGAGRLWQREAKNGANTLTISGGHNIDALCTILGEFTEVQARTTTQITEWIDTDNGNAPVPVDSPDTIIVAGRLASGADVSIHVTAVPIGATGTRLEIFGDQGALILDSRGSLSGGPNTISGAKAGERPAELTVPDTYTVVPEGTPAGPPRNVGQAYVAMADTLEGKPSQAPDFALAVQRHKLIDAIERSSRDGVAVKL